MSMLLLLFFFLPYALILQFGVEQVGASLTLQHTFAGSLPSRLVSRVSPVVLCDYLSGEKFHCMVSATSSVSPSHKAGEETLVCLTAEKSGRHHLQGYLAPWLLRESLRILDTKSELLDL